MSNPTQPEEEEIHHADHDAVALLLAKLASRHLPAAPYETDFQSLQGITGEIRGLLPAFAKIRKFV